MSRTATAVVVASAIAGAATVAVAPGRPGLAAPLLLD